MIHQPPPHPTRPAHRFPPQPCSAKLARVRSPLKTRLWLGMSEEGPGRERQAAAISAWRAATQTRHNADTLFVATQAHSRFARTQVPLASKGFVHLLLMLVHEYLYIHQRITSIAVQIATVAAYHLNSCADTASPATGSALPLRGRLPRLLPRATARPPAHPLRGSRRVRGGAGSRTCCHATVRAWRQSTSRSSSKASTTSIITCPSSPS